MGFEPSLFVDQPVSSSLLCAICREVMKEAQTACGQGHAFCKACIEPSTVTDCPSCRGSLIKTNCLALRNLIDDLKVKCPNKSISSSADENNKNNNSPPKKKRRKSAAAASAAKNKSPDACDWVGPLCQLEAHKKDSCKFQLVPCEFDNCKEQVARKDLKKHASQCGFRPVTCKKCKATIPSNSMPHHQCPREMTSCCFCDKRMLRKELLGAGDPNYVKEKDGSSDKKQAPTGASAAANNNNSSTLNPTDSPAGRELLQAIMSERMPFVPTSDECEGHYRECPEVMLRCEFHNYGCTDRIARKDLAKHHADKAQQHAALVSDALDELHERIDTGVRREHVKLIFGMERYYISGNRSLRSDSSSFGGIDLHLKLHLHRDANRGVSVSIRASNRQRAMDVIQLYDVKIGVSTKKLEDPQIMFEDPGPMDLTQETYGIESTRVDLEYEDECGVHDVTGNKLRQLVTDTSESKIYLVASFSMSAERTRYMDGVYGTSSPSPSPNASPAREYGDY